MALFYWRAQLRLASPVALCPQCAHCGQPYPLRFRRFALQTCGMLPSMNPLPTYLVIGHTTLDRLPQGAESPGGTALYAALAAQRLGLATAVVTAAATLPADFAGLPVACRAAQHNTTLAHAYHNGLREQRIEAIAPPLTIEVVPDAWRNASVVHLGPVLGECELALLEAFPNSMVGASGQGWLRGWQGELPAMMERRAWHPDPTLLARLALLTLSIEDLGGDESIAEGYAQYCPLLALTRGAGGLTLFVQGVPHAVAAYPAHERDPNGAGDVFTAAMLCRLYETHDPFEAARFGAAAAACAVEGFTYTALPTREQVVEKMNGAALNS
jgi:sugar/nucleoside kinase (ribokinase family)